MMSDLIERLENPSWSNCTCDFVMAEAAQAITALTAENKRLRELLAAVDSRGLPDRYNSDVELQEQVTAALKGKS